LAWPDVADLTRDRRDVDDAPRATLDHVLERRLGHVKSARRIDAQDLVPVVDGHAQDRPVHGDAGVVDEDVEPAVLLDHLADDAKAVVRIAHVAPVNARPCATVLDRVAELLGAREIRREPSADRRATMCQPPRAGGADTARTAVTSATRPASDSSSSARSTLAAEASIATLPPVCS
jgi:hypothetical protein